MLVLALLALLLVLVLVLALPLLLLIPNQQQRSDLGLAPAEREQLRRAAARLVREQRRHPAQGAAGSTLPVGDQRLRQGAAGDPLANRARVR